MVTFRNNNNRRNNFRRNDRTFKPNGDRGKYSNFSNNDNFQRRIPSRNNHNAPKLIEKYNNLAREALSGGDKILSENYFQHADHFTRVQNEQENFKKTRFALDNTESKNSEIDKSEDEKVKKEESKEKVEAKVSLANN